MNDIIFARCEDCIYYHHSAIDRTDVCINPESAFSGEAMLPDESCYEFKEREEE